MSENELSFVLLIEPFHNGVGVLRHNLRVDAADQDKLSVMTVTSLHTRGTRRRLDRPFLMVRSLRSLSACCAPC